MNRSKWILLLLAVATCAPGCVPRVKVRKNPGPGDTGIRYYRPKPYLLLTPGGGSVQVVEEEGKKTTTTTASDEFVNIQLQYLPDFSEEYAIEVKTGLGKADVSLKLEDGWNLTAINQNLDSQTDENIAATAELLKAVGGLVPTSNALAASESEATNQKWVVRATNVPLGYYESVIGVGPDCKKRLYGWRYVGFAPFNSCPTTLCGHQSANCANDPYGPIYGLAFVKGVMTFTNLAELQGNRTPAKKTLVAFGNETNGGGPGADRDSPEAPPASVEVHNADELFQVVEPILSKELRESLSRDLVKLESAPSADDSVDYVVTIWFSYEGLTSQDISSVYQQLQGAIADAVSNARVRLDVVDARHQ